MRASVYDWMKQTPEHEEYARMAYPLVHDLAKSTNNWNDFCRYAQGLPPAQKLRYVAEEGKWRTQFGDAWKAMGCLRESRIGQRSSGREVYGGRTRNSLMGITGAIAGLRTPSYPRNVISGLDDRPPLPAGYTAYTTPPESQLQWTGDWQTVPGYFVWMKRTATGPKGACIIYLRNDLSDSFMAVGGGAVTMAAADCKALQIALNEQYLAPENALTVDGILGPKTCRALHWFQYEYKGIDSAKIDPYTYMSLNLPLRFGQQYTDVCTKYYTGDYTPPPPSEIGSKPPTPAPTPDPEPPPEPVEEEAGFNKYLLIGAVAVLGGGLLAWKIKGKKGKKAR